MIVLGKIGFIIFFFKYYFLVLWFFGVKFDGKVDLNCGCGGVFFSD